MVSVSRATNSPGRIFRPPASLNQGLVRCPEVSSRVSMNSPPCRMTSWYMMAKKSFSETPPSRAPPRPRRFGAGHRYLQAFDLLLRLDGANGQYLALAIADLAAAPGQRQG